MRRARMRAAAIAVLVSVGWIAVLPSAAEEPTLAPEVLASAPTPEASSLEATLVDAAWLDPTQDLAQRALQTRLIALQLGAANVEPAARALLAEPAAADRLANGLMAVRLAPDLPTAHMSLARVLWQEGEHRAAASEVFAGLAAIPRHLEATVWLVATLLIFLTGVLVLGSLAFVGLVSISVLSHASHDIGDLFFRGMPGFARGALLGSLVLLPLLFGEGVLGFSAGLLALGFAYGASNHRMALTLAVMLIVIGMYPIARMAGMALTALDSDPIAQAALSVSRGTGSPWELALLADAADDDPMAEILLAMHARRSGDLAGAATRYAELQRKLPRDEVVLTNLANLRFHSGDLEGATDLYQRSAELVDSATLQFNLSQAYAKSFKIQEFENALELAQQIEPQVVAELSQIASADVVADLPFPTHRVRDRMIASSDGRGFASELRAPLGAGRMSESWQATSIGFALAAFAGLLIGGRYDHSSVCRRCGQRICSRCDGTVWNKETCENCYTLFHRPETTDSGLRVTRLNQLRGRESRQEKLATLASLAMPGAAGLLVQRPDMGFVGILLFAWAALSFLWRDGVVSDPMAVGAAGPLAFLMTGAVAAIAYMMVVGRCLIIRRGQ